MTCFQDGTLVNGVPCLALNDGATALFSPYSKQVAVIDPQFDDGEYVLRRLALSRFFGRPSDSGPMKSDHFDITMILTSACNLFCRYCFADSGQDHFAHMSVDTALASLTRLVDGLEARKLSITFFGGEPTLNVEVIKAVVNQTKALRIGQSVEVTYSITTNGVMPARVLADLISERFFFNISADGPPEIQDYQRPTKRGTGTHLAVEETLRRLSEAAAPFKIRTTVTDRSVARLDDIVRYYHSLGANLVHFEPMTYAGRGGYRTGAEPSLRRPDPEAYRSNFGRALDVADALGVKLVSSYYMNFLSPALEYCDAHSRRRVVVTKDGGLSRCLEIQDGCHEFAGYGWISPHARSLPLPTLPPREIRSQGARDCDQCFARYTCGGGCPVRNLRGSGQASIVDAYECSLHAGLLRDVLTRVAARSRKSGTHLDRDRYGYLYALALPPSVFMKREDELSSQELLTIELS